MRSVVAVIIIATFMLVGPLATAGHALAVGTAVALRPFCIQGVVNTDATGDPQMRSASDVRFSACV